MEWSLVKLLMGETALMLWDGPPSQDHGIRARACRDCTGRLVREKLAVRPELQNSLGTQKTRYRKGSRLTRQVSGKVQVSISVSKPEFQ